MKNIFQKIIDFIKYHNAFTIGLALVFVFSGAIFASEDVRDAVIGEEIITEIGIDNSQLLLADLDNFDVDLTIDNVLEDDKSYYIGYSFNTIAVQDNVWQPIVKLEKFTVNKEGLGNRDLGLYLAEELGEVANSEITYLRELQKTEKEKGETLIVETLEYTGLIGLILDTETRVLPGYEPVIPEPQQEICHGLDNDCDEEIDEDVDCGAISCDASLNLVGEDCENTCVDGECQICVPVCVCSEGFSDCDSDMTNGCETEGDCVFVEEVEE